MAWTGLIRLMQGQVLCSFTDGNGFSVSIKRMEFIDQLTNYYLLIKDYAACIYLVN
jgi:hypothetical protein